MNFFEAQDAARRSTAWLVLLFALAVIGLITLTNFLAMYLMSYLQTGMLVLVDGTMDAYLDSGIYAIVAVAVTVLILSGSLYKMIQLSSGGRAVAESLGATIVPQATDVAAQRKLLNVVEEMAIASGTPVPSVYMLDDSSINAFAAGLTTGDAVVAVTRGAVEQLSRDELQGVIAHEFSHILNGDMRLNLRLTGILHGILLLGMIGYYLVRMLRHTRRSSSRNGAGGIFVVLLLGLGLMVIGYVGTFFGNIIKSMISRQREYLADASSVQFTRNKNGIANALKKIGGSTLGSRLTSPNAPEYSHAYFAQGVSVWIESLFATHPPLEKRIRRIQPYWSGRFITPKPSEPEPEETQTAEDKDDKKMRMMGAMGAGAAAASVISAIEHIGVPDDVHIGYAHNLLLALPEVLNMEVRDAYGARAVVYSMLLHGNHELKNMQWQILQQRADKGVYQKTQQLAATVDGLDRELRLPLLDLATPALRELSAPQYQQFREVVLELMQADKKLDLSEWVIQRTLLHHLDYGHGLRKRPRAKYSILGDVKTESEILLSAIAYAEHNNSDEAAQRAFDMGKKAIGAGALNIVPRKGLSLRILDGAVDKLDMLKPLMKPRLLKACAACIAADGEATSVGIELLRAISSSLDCPMPPIISGS